MQIKDMTKPADRVFTVLKDHPDVVRAIFETYHYPAPWIGWAPMLCEICRDVKQGKRDSR